MWGLCGVRGVASWTRTRTPNVDTANYINQHFVAVKVDFDASPKLVAQLQQAQAVLNLPARLPLTSFITTTPRYPRLDLDATTTAVDDVV
jgi:hypothetical protein